MSSSIAKLWAKQIKNGNKTIDDVPKKLREEVQRILDEENE